MWGVFVPIILIGTTIGNIILKVVWIKDGGEFGLDDLDFKSGLLSILSIICSLAFALTFHRMTQFGEETKWVYVNTGTDAGTSGGLYIFIYLAIHYIVCWGIAHIFCKVLKWK